MWLLLTELAVTFAVLVTASVHYLYMLQLESYQVDGYLRHLKRNPMEWRGWPLMLGVSCAVSQWVLPVIFSISTGDQADAKKYTHLFLLAVFVCYAAKKILDSYRTPRKKPPKFTPRMRRLTLCHIGLLAAFTALYALIFAHDITDKGLRLMYLSSFILLAVLPWLVALSAKVMEPYERRINRGFFRQARQKLDASKDLIRVGITGSYGKTGTKFALTTILSEKYRVLTSTSSINTPMGLSKLINTELNPSHQVFVAEMGARHVGDIEELTELVGPTMGLITSVGPQHLETFGNIETVAETKYELIKALPKDGVALFASDGAWTDKLYARTKCEKYLTGVGEGKYDLRAEDVEVGSFGSRFTLKSASGESIRVETGLLGRHNISNLVLCCCAAARLGLTMDEIASGLKKIKPVEHRLQLISGPVNVIDDSFNSNPSGAAEALNVLSGFSGKRIIITPGMVEMGPEEDRFNYEFGCKMASCADIAILVGPKHSAPIREGLLKNGFNEKCIHTAKNLDEATQIQRKLTAVGDTVLFENDLPDNYNE